jgi:hypothetical protein
MHKFVITVRTKGGRFRGTGVARNSFSLFDMALAQFGEAALSISVRAV